ncbi:ribose-phosphate pyrophosphokinase [Coriobacteriia bacterium Es71-Z0120]|uniref:ribose-phosphate diphosphokinase n=1 Tax=Parvivirga hydrogeniphila TaxID=2939460 RepID=UPI002260B215|nr:ribose-phosphate pyrophosphokinase [Parvivirga hydrogeniphila]MCL4079502.1 ribose-phosphate pyrophosphokinase [Parvivirga hydrogeniphila]
MGESGKRMMVFSGTHNRELAEGIVKHLGIELGNIKISKFANGEIYVRYLESVRGADVFLVQSMCQPVNASIMELLIMVDAAKRASARTITAVIPHYAYARQDKKSAAREPITAKLVADLLTVAGVDRVIAMDLHQGQIQGFFNQPVNHLTALPILADYFESLNLENLTIVSPDVGRVKVCKKLADMLGASLAIMHKGRPEHNVAEITHVIGEVEGKTCIIADDMIDTAGSVTEGARALVNKGAVAVYVAATHGIFSPPAYDRIDSAPIQEVVVTNTMPVPEERRHGKIRVLSVAPLFAHAIQNVYNDESVSELFDPDFQL